MSQNISDGAVSKEPLSSLRFDVLECGATTCYWAKRPLHIIYGVPSQSNQHLVTIQQKARQVANQAYFPKIPNGACAASSIARTNVNCWS